MSDHPLISSPRTAHRRHDRETTYWPSLHPTSDGERIMTPGVRKRRPAKMPRGSQAIGPSGPVRQPYDQQRNDRHLNELCGDGKMAEQGGNNAAGVLWVDAVGGYLITLKDELLLGQAQPGNGAADIRIQADVSRNHARLRRLGEDYLIEPLAIVTVGGQPIVTARPLADGDLIGLGHSVELRFRKPHPLSNTVRLDLTTGQRLEPFVDGIILMGETCLLGPAPVNHVVCPHWDGNLVLSRLETESLRFRADDRVEVDGQSVGDKGDIRWGSRMTGKNFAITLERL